MTLVKWEPWREVQLLRDRFDRLFGEPFFHPVTEAEGRIYAEWIPAVDMYEDADKMEFTAELPGMDMKDIEVKIEDETLRISGERTLENEEHRENYHRVERVYGTFHRTITLPKTVETEKVKAVYEKGVLRVTLPKREEVKPKKIDVVVKG